MTSPTLDIVPLTGALGAEVSNIDLAEPLECAARDAVRDALLENQVLVFRDQELTPQRQVEIARIFGRPAIYPFLKGLDQAPEVNALIKKKDDRDNFGGTWHSDTAYKPQPDMGTLLYALDVPDAGGDTLFANMRLAYDALSDGMKALLDGLVGSTVRNAAMAASGRNG